jgi:hypothetical protein
LQPITHVRRIGKETKDAIGFPFPLQKEEDAIGFSTPNARAT